MNKFSKALIKSLGEAADHAEDRASIARVYVLEVPDGRAIRASYLSQEEFAESYRIPLPTLRNWEGGGNRAGRAGGSLSSRDREAPTRNQRMLLSFAEIDEI